MFSSNGGKFIVTCLWKVVMSNHARFLQKKKEKRKEKKGGGKKEIELG